MPNERGIVLLIRKADSSVLQQKCGPLNPSIIVVRLQYSPSIYQYCKFLYQYQPVLMKRAWRLLWRFQTDTGHWRNHYKSAAKKFTYQIKTAKQRSD